jgi:hypothetical protein
MNAGARLVDLLPTPRALLMRSSDACLAQASHAVAFRNQNRGQPFGNQRGHMHVPPVDAKARMGCSLQGGYRQVQTDRGAKPVQMALPLASMYWGGSEVHPPCPANRGRASVSEVSHRAVA